jgi:hypothetical protein
MAIARQSDTIWAEAAMGYGRQHSPAQDEDHHGLGSAARSYGESMGRKHAGESIDHYHRDEKGRFAPMAHHDSEHEHAAGKIKREHRDSFHESYHKGFHSKIKEHEKAEKDKANKTSMVVEAIHVDPLTGALHMEDPERFRYSLEHGSDEGYVEPSWLDKMHARSPQREVWKARQPTDKDPYRYDTDTLLNIANDPHFGLSLGMSNKAPFSRADVGLATGDGRRKENKGRATLRPGELASAPVRVEDHLGNTHTFVHQVTAPNLNLHNPDEPEAGGPWVVSLHHHISRPDGTHEWLPSEVSHHQPGQGNRASDDLHRDIWGQLHANSDMVSMYGAGAQRVGDKNTSIEYEFPHPKGDVVYRAKMANGWNKHDGYYYDPSLPERHKEALPRGPQWIVTGKGLERQHAHDPSSDTRMVTIEGRDSPGPGTIAFDKEDLPGVIQHVWNGLGVRPDRPSWAQWQQHQMPNRGGKPSAQMIRGHAAVRSWLPEHNIIRSAERLPVNW